MGALEAFDNVLGADNFSSLRCTRDSGAVGHKRKYTYPLHDGDVGLGSTDTSSGPAAGDFPTELLRGLSSGGEIGGTCKGCYVWSSVVVSSGLID